jgi:hypothetical protein
VLAGALGVLSSLGRPWYGSPPPGTPSAGTGVGELAGPLASVGAEVHRWASASGGLTGWAALGGCGTLLGVLAVATALGALACTAPAMQGAGRELVRYAALATCAIAAWRLLDPPAAAHAMELRQGAFAAAGSALVLAASALGVASAPLRRPVERPRYVAVPPPAPYEGGRRVAGA